MRDVSSLLPWTAEPDPAPEFDPLGAAYARGQAEGEAQARRLLSEIRLETAARGRLHDPSDAPAMIDLGTVDPQDPRSIEAAISGLIASKPHLAVPAAPPPATGDDWMREGFRARKATRMFP